MRKTALNMVYHLAKTDERVCFIGSDLGFGVLDDFKRDFPNRFFMEGISEQHIIGMAAGMAMEGKIVYVNTIASFLTRRCFEQIMLDLGLHRAKVRLIGSGGGLVYAPLGPTHQTFEDFALMRSVPGMTVLAPADADEMRRLMPLTLDVDGPVYIRLAKGNDPIISREEIPVSIGKAVPLLNDSEAEALFISTGVGAQLAAEAAGLLTEQGIKTALLHCHTLKPFDDTAVLSRAAKAKSVFSVEEHGKSGGLGSIVAELLAESDLNVYFRRFALPDGFSNGYGSQKEQWESCGFTAGQLAELVRQSGSANGWNRSKGMSGRKE